MASAGHSDATIVWDRFRSRRHPGIADGVAGVLLGAECVWAVVAALAAVATTLWAFGGADLLTGRPVKFTGDAVFHYALAKMVLEDSWTWHSSRLGAPFGSTMAAFGVGLPVESALMNVLALSTDDAITLLNRTWVLLVGLTALSSHAAFRLLGLPRSAALVCGCLFATGPCVLLRHVAHFNLHCGFVALPLAAAVLVAGGGIAGLQPRTFVFVCLGCLLAGLGYVYYPFFHALVLAFALGLAWLTGRRAGLRRGLVCLLVLLVAAAANLLPTLVARAREGSAPALDYKHPAEADVFALRPRDLLVPSGASLIPPLAAIGRRVEAIDWPLTNENRHAKLGICGSLGFLVGFAVLAGCRPPVPPDLAAATRAAAALILFLVLLAVSGGFGSIFNAFVSPQIRCYNRVAPLVLFLSLLISGSCLTNMLAGRHRAVTGCAWAAMLAFGLVEQNVVAATRGLAASTQEERAALEPFVESLEASLPPAATICMLPFTPFPGDSGSGRMEPYDHAKPWLFSARARWSWPVFGSRHASLVAACGDPATPGFVGRLRRAGYSHVWLDMHGRPEEVESLTRAIDAAVATPPRTDSRGRYRVYDLSAVPAG
jgi:hypothetical protein